ncbi:MAG: glycine zipper 2TM domain-containing protein [Pseudomonadales bacterium]
MKKSAKLIPIIALSALLGGCATSNLSGDTYTRDEARAVQNVQYGTIISARPVVIEGRTEGVVGTAGGAAIGGIAGSGVGGGSGRQIATVAGAILGGIIGQNIEERATRAQGQELTVRLDSGETISVVQQVDQANFFSANERVKYLNHNGTARISY